MTDHDDAQAMANYDQLAADLFAGIPEEAVTGDNDAEYIASCQADILLTSDWLVGYVARQVEAVTRSRDALIEKVKRLEDQIARAAMDPGQDRAKAMHVYAKSAEKAEQERDEALAAVADAARIALGWDDRQSLHDQIERAEAEKRRAVDEALDYLIERAKRAGAVLEQQRPSLAQSQVDLLRAKRDGVNLVRSYIEELRRG